MFFAKSAPSVEPGTGARNQRSRMPWVAISSSNLRVAMGVLLVFVGTVPALRAQIPECQKPELARQACPNPKGNLQDDASATLACKWISAQANALKALKLLTQSTPAGDVNKEVQEILSKNDAAHEDLSQAALGGADASDEFHAVGVPNFTDFLVKANTLKIPTDAVGKQQYGNSLFACREKIIQRVFVSQSGKTVPVDVNDYFDRNLAYVATWHLFPYIAMHPSTPDPPSDMEKLRAAFAADRDKLAKQIAATIKPVNP
jgi:hypothetical protein